MKGTVKTTCFVSSGLLLAALLVSFTLFPSDALPADSPVSQKKNVAIVIDDFGNNMAGTAEIIELPFHLTIAVMPFQRTTQRDAEWAYHAGHDVFVHIPMEPLSKNVRGLGKGAITTDLSDEEIRLRVNDAIDDVPHAVGINNHMGSKATADRRVMRAVLQVCRERGLTFLDSKTNHLSIAGEVAKELGVHYAENHLFLDNKNSSRYIQNQIGRIYQHLSNKDSCVAIGHVGRPGKKTAAVLKKTLPELNKKANLVGVTQLFRLKNSPLPITN
ncbi:divergent polysaccharide deacetylase family protein [Brevibacillus massiliensis]|uniref:divergent polysaccharide deacetylase family protein n=1 Tax=Brevibacillus massiliensis TaxID=1118054 RepID=UPI0002D9928A|nr:divergent polysaccharide deacetylase family protein [Brevibacillus massiliensis]